MKLSKMISELDTVTGMLTVAAMKDPIVRQAMEKVIKVSIALGDLAMEEEANHDTLQR